MSHKEAIISRHFKEIAHKRFNPIEEVKFWMEKAKQSVLPAWAFKSEGREWLKKNFKKDDWLSKIRKDITDEELD